MTALSHVAGHIEPGPQALALMNLARDVWGPHHGPAGRVVGFISPSALFQRDDETPHGGVSHRAAMDPRHEGTDPNPSRNSP